MATIEVTAADRARFTKARAAGEKHSHDASAVVNAAYDAVRDAIELRFRGGGTMMIPRKLIPGLDKAGRSRLRSIDVSPAGDAISWRSLDIDIYVPGLVERAFGTRLFAAATGQRGGRRRSKSKAAAAKANGAKGGRPRKRVSA